MIELIPKMLKSAGDAFLLAEVPVDGLETAKSYAGPIDVSPTDVIMPGVTGPSVSRAIRSDTTRGRNSFHVCYSENIVDHRGELLGGASFISKPFTKSECHEFAGLAWAALRMYFLRLLPEETAPSPGSGDQLQTVRAGLLQVIRPEGPRISAAGVRMRCHRDYDVFALLVVKTFHPQQHLLSFTTRNCARHESRSQARLFVQNSLH